MLNYVAIGKLLTGSVVSVSSTLVMFFFSMSYVSVLNLSAVLPLNTCIQSDICNIN